MRTKVDGARYERKRLLLDEVSADARHIPLREEGPHVVEKFRHAEAEDRIAEVFESLVVEDFVLRLVGKGFMNEGLIEEVGLFKKVSQIFFERPQVFPSTNIHQLISRPCQ